MSEKTNNLLHLFSKLLRNPNVLFALRADKISNQMKNRGNRNGAQGLLVELWNKDGLTNAEIAELLDIKPSSVTAQVKQLEEAQMVERHQDENDKRVSRVFLTDKGRAVKEERAEFHDDLSENIFGSLTDEEQDQLLDLMEKLVANNNPKDEKDYQRMARMFGDPMMENLQNAHNRHVFGNHMRREMQNWQREMQRQGRDMKRANNDMRRAMRDSMPFGEDWKNLGRMMKDSFRKNFGGSDDADFNEHWENFSNEMKNRFGDREGWDGHGFDDGHGYGSPRGYFDRKHEDFRSQPGFDKDKEPKGPENWDDF